LRCINLAKRGMLAYLLEFIYFGQLDDRENRHNALVQLDLCGTSGVAPFVLALTRGLDAALTHPHADQTRVGVAGLSGGGWQTIMLASLDERIRLANPVAGHASLFTRAQYTRDVGDCEQVPSDMCTVADYTHLTAMVAPRPLLLTFNAKDECCFLPEGSLPPLQAAAGPVYELFKASDRFRTHINHEPGTHNFERENREMLYRLVGDSFFPGDTGFERSDLSVPESELKDGEELAVPMPAENATLHSLAVQISSNLPNRIESGSDRTGSRARLRETIRLERYEVCPRSSGEGEVGGIKTVHWQMRMGDEWTIPAVEFAPSGAQGCTVVIGDRGRREMPDTVHALLEAGERVVAADLLGFGEAGKGIEPIELHMIASVGRRPLGVQAAQLLALADWCAGDASRPKLVAVGPRSSVIALVTAALEPEAFETIELHDSWPSLKEFIHKNMELEDAPELGCFGLLQVFDIPQLEALAAPQTVSRIEGK
jgi:dienelactone hydrolase